MRRLFIPLVVLAVTVAATVLTQEANDSADPGDPPITEAGEQLGTPILSVRRAPEWLRRPTADGQLELATSAVLRGSDVPDAACLAVRRDGVDITGEGLGIGLQPAELERLVVIAALDALGTDAGFTTEVVRERNAEIEEGTLTGDLWLVGGGDPVLATAEYTARFGDDRVFTDLDVLAADVARALAAQGITRIEGRVVGDETRYTPTERDYVGGAWDGDDNADNVVGPLSGLLVNDGYRWNAEDGSVSRTSDPAAEAAAVFDDLLTERGLEITRAPTSGEQPASVDQVAIASIESPALRDIAARALVDGTTAEMLFKEAGLRFGTGSQQLEAAFGVFLALDGVDHPMELGVTNPADGSGLSSLNLTTCDLLLEILDDPERTAVASILPDIADGPLAACPRGDGTLHVYSSARGTTTGMVGRLRAENGDTITFAMLANATTDPEGEPPAPFEACNDIQRAILGAVTGHPYGPDLEELTPLPVVDADGS